MDKPPPEESGRTSDGRLTSWKEIAVYLKRDIPTVQRWEKREGMPVHRHLHDRMGSVYAFRTELDAWTRGRNLPAAKENVAPLNSVESPPKAEAPTSAGRRRMWLWLLAATIVV